MVCPATTGEVLQVLTMERSAEVVTGLVTDEVLLAGTGSGVGLLTLAVLTTLPVTLLLTIPRIRMDTELPEVIVPTPYGLIHGFHVVPPLTENSGLEIPEGTASLIATLTASLVPRFCTVIVY